MACSQSLIRGGDEIRSPYLPCGGVASLAVTGDFIIAQHPREGVLWGGYMKAN